MSRSPAVFLAAVLLSTSLSAATPCTRGFEAPDRLVGGITGIINTVYADFNGDGLTDIAAHDNFHIAIFLNRGNGVFEPVQSIGTLDGPGAIRAAFDVTGDGKADLISSGASDIAVWRGNGDGTFVTTPVVTRKTTGTDFIGIADMDGDGKKDLVFADTGSGNAGIAFYRSAGDGTYTRGGGFAWPTNATNPATFALGDFDGDGRVDVARRDADALAADVVFAYNKGDGTFVTDSSITYIPRFDTVPGISGVDVDGDGVAEVVSFGRTTLTVIRAGGRKATAETTTYDPYLTLPLLSGSVLGLADLDEDGFPDLVLGTVRQLTVFRGSATHQFSQPSTYFVSGTPALADMNGDGFKDLVDAGYGIRAVYARKVRDLALRMYAPPTTQQRTILADVTGDAIADLLTFDITNGNFSVYAGLPGGGFSTSPKAAVGVGTYASIVTGDFDGDGIPDVAEGFTAFANGVGTPAIKIYFGNGTGSFASAATLQIASAQLDGSGRFAAGDALVATVGGAAQLITAPHRQPSPGAAYNIPAGAPVFVADVDGDGRSDLLVAASDGLHIVKQSSGAWQETGTVKMSTFGIRIITTGDLNGDGRTDVVVNKGSTTSALMGNSSGGFDVENLANLDGAVDPTVVVGDIDSSGKSSVILGGINWLTIVRRQDAGGYSQAVVALDTFDSSSPTNRPLAVIDETGDGVPDLLLENGVVLAAGCAPPRLKVVAPSFVRSGDTATFIVQVNPSDEVLGSLGFTVSENGKVLGTGGPRWTSAPLAAGTHVFTISSRDQFVGPIEQTVTIAVVSAHGHAAKH